MTEIEFLDAPVVKLIDHMGDDMSIVRAARVSVTGANHDETVPEMDAKIADQWAVDMKGMSSEEAARYMMTYFKDLKADQDKKDKGLINYLAREKHGSPFEHTAMTFYVEAPIFVFREFHRHRIGFSYNEMSGRYTKLPPRFYIPNEDRPLVNAGTSSRPEMVPGSSEQHKIMAHGLKTVYREAWEIYEDLIEEGVANEVARAVLPVGIMSQMYVTTNVRAIFNFLALRTKRENATFVSRPQREIEMVAELMESEVARLFPIAYEAWNKNGRVAP